LIRLAVEKQGKRKLQDILEFLEFNKGLTTQQIESRLKAKGKVAHNTEWALAA